MRRICCSIFHKGDCFFGEKEPLENKVETHGYCDTCFPREMEMAMKELERIHKENAEKTIYQK